MNKIVIGKGVIEGEGEYKRYRQRSPRLFKPKSFRTLPMGKSGLKGIFGRLKKGNKFVLQSKLVPVQPHNRSGTRGVRGHSRYVKRRV